MPEENTILLEDLLAQLPNIIPMKRPEGISDDYQFFINEETGNAWKAKLVMTAVHSNKDFAPSVLGATITVSPVDKQGKALRESDKPVVIDSHTHSFNEVEMSAPDFDPKKRILMIIAERIKAGEGRMTGVTLVNDLLDVWKQDTSL